MLDPRHLGLNAESVGFQVSHRQPVDWKSFSVALQNQSDSVKVRRELQETPISELHIMGGQLFGFEGNSLLDTRKRQERQINGYRLRSFTAKDSAVVMPPKDAGSLNMAIPAAAGLVQYNRWNSVIPQTLMLRSGEPGLLPLSQDERVKEMLGLYQSQEEQAANLQEHNKKRSREYQNATAEEQFRTEIEQLRKVQTNPNLSDSQIRAASVRLEKAVAQLESMREGSKSSIHTSDAVHTGISARYNQIGSGVVRTHHPDAEEKASLEEDALPFSNTDTDMAFSEPSKKSRGSRMLKRFKTKTPREPSQSSSSAESFKRSVIINRSKSLSEIAPQTSRESNIYDSGGQTPIRITNLAVDLTDSPSLNTSMDEKNYKARKVVANEAFRVNEVPANTNFENSATSRIIGSQARALQDLRNQSGTRGSANQAGSKVFSSPANSQVSQVSPNSIFNFGTPPTQVRQYGNNEGPASASTVIASGRSSSSRDGLKDRTKGSTITKLLSPRGNKVTQTF